MSPTTPPTQPEHSSAFLDQAGRYSTKTHASYHTALGAFQRFAEIHSLTSADTPCPTAALSEGTLVAFYDWLCQPHGPASKPYSDATIRLYLTVVVRYIKWLAGHRYLQDGLQVEVLLAQLDLSAGTRGPGRRAPKHRKADPRIGVLLIHFATQLADPPAFVREKPDSTRAQWWRLIQLRNHALMQTLYSTAGRVAEIVALRCGDVRTGEALIEVIGKGKKRRVVVLTPSAQAALDIYIEARQAADSAPLFVSHGPRGTDRALGPQMIWKIADEAARAVFGVDRQGRPRRRAHPHLFRHLRAQDLHDEGLPITLLQALLGHADISTTRRVYAGETDPQQLLDAVQTYGRAPEDVVKRGEKALGRKKA